jgi:hypothetical protein
MNGAREPTPASAPGPAPPAAPPTTGELPAASSTAEVTPEQQPCTVLGGLVDATGKTSVIDVGPLNPDLYDECAHLVGVWLRNRLQLLRLDAFRGSSAGLAWRREIHASEIRIARERLQLIGAVSEA